MLQEIQEKFNQLLEERQKLHSSWQHKKVHLDQLIDLHFFLRDAKQIDTLCSTQEAALSGVDFGTLCLNLFISKDFVIASLPSQRSNIFK